MWPTFELRRLLPAARHVRSRPSRAHPRRRPSGSRAAAGGRPHGQGRSNPAALPASGLCRALPRSSRLRLVRPQRRRPQWRGELVARRLALAAAVAVSLLAVSGAGGAATQQTPKRGGTVVVGAGLFEPACLNILRSCGPFPHLYIEEVLEGAFEIGPRHVRPNLVSHVDRETPLELMYHIRPAARWSDGVP